MDLRLLRLVHNRVRAEVAGAEAAALDTMLAVVERTADLQSEPAAASGLLEFYRNLADWEAALAALGRRIANGRPPGAPEWLQLACLAMFNHVVTEAWEPSYVPILESNPALRSKIESWLAAIEAIPFAQALHIAETDWKELRGNAQAAALLCVRACGLAGVVAPARLGEKIADLLTPEHAFLTVVLAAACFKVSAIAARVNIGNWSDTQYACMRLLDHFNELGETAWG